MPEYPELEIAVANACGPTTRRQIEQSYPSVRVVDIAAGLSIAAARHAAIQQTSGAVVAVLHERYRVPENWIELIQLAHAMETAEVIAGCVGPPLQQSTAEWAMYLTEYNGVAPPLSSGQLARNAVSAIPGGNVSYKRAVFEKASMADYLWELDFHAALFDRGIRFYRDSAILAEFGQPYTTAAYVAERLAVSRDFASHRMAGRPLIARMASAAIRAALPPLVIARVGQAVLRNKTYAGAFVTAFPWVAAFSLVQAWGEAAGSIRIPPSVPRS